MSLCPWDLTLGLVCNNFSAGTKNITAVAFLCFLFNNAVPFLTSSGGGGGGTSLTHSFLPTRLDTRLSKESDRNMI